MPPKKNPKKGGVSDEEILKTITVVKQYWPDYSITIQNIREPTREFVLQFYSDCVENMDEMCAFITKTRPPIPPNLSSEEVLFFKMSMIPHLNDTGFKLGDLYVFEPKRVSTYILITVAFLMQIEGVMDKAVTIRDRAFNQATELEHAKIEIQKLKTNTLQRQIDLTTAKEELRKVNQIADELAPKYAKVLELIEESQEKCKDTISEIANIKSKQDCISEEIKGLQELEVELKKQVVTKEEVENLQVKYDQLMKKEKFLTELDDDNNLLILKQQLEKIECCLQELDGLDVPQELFALADLRTALKNEKRNISQFVTSQESFKTKMDHLKGDLDKEELEVSQENRDLLDALRLTDEKGMEERCECQTNYRNILKSKEKQKNNLEEQLTSQMEEYSKTVTILQAKYEILVNMQDSIGKKFEVFCNQFNMLRK